MNFYIVAGILLPFLGTTAGSACVFLLKNNLNRKIHRALNGFAGGVMIAASVWSLLIPSIDSSENLGKFAFVPAATGLWLGILFIYSLNKISEFLYSKNMLKNRKSEKHKKNNLLMLAVTLHNIPEGMAVGVAFAGVIFNESQITLTQALTLAIGIAIQNFPEGAIISMPLKSGGKCKKEAFLYGTLSGFVEPIATALTILTAWIVVPVLPYFLSFAAGAMIYVVVSELIPESHKSNDNLCVIMFTLGFSVMMALDVALG